MLFPIWILEALIVGSLIFTAVGSVVLIYLLWKDYIKKEIW